MDLPINSVFRPSTFDEAIEAFANEPTMLPICGGTDLAVQLRAGRFGGRRLLDVSGVVPTAITSGEQFVEIGAGATMDQIADSQAIRSISPGLCEAARQVGAWPIQCRATLGGNLANASPAADTAPPLMVSDAVITAISLEGRREIEAAKFFKGPGRTALEPGELIQSILLPVEKRSAFNRFTKLGWQSEQIISVVSLAISLNFADQGVVNRAAVALGSVAPTPVRAHRVEVVLVGNSINSSTKERAIQAVVDDISPIDDVRAPGWYRRVAAATLLDRMLEEAKDA